MNAPFKTPNTEAPLWDLTDLYASRDDAKVAADLAARVCAQTLGERLQSELSFEALRRRL